MSNVILVHRARSILAAFILTTASFAVSAAESEELVPARFSFQFARAELATVPAIDKLYGRLVRDARKACRVIGSELWKSKAREACEADLIDKVVARIGKPDLTVRHQGSRYFDLARQLEEQKDLHRIARRTGD